MSIEIDGGNKWTVHDVCGNAIGVFRRCFDADWPFIFVLYRKASTMGSSFHSNGQTVQIIRSRDIIHDNELYAYLPGRQFLLAFWTNGEYYEPPLPIEIKNLEDALMTPIEPIYDEEGNEAGWKMRPATGHDAKDAGTRGKADPDPKGNAKGHDDKSAGTRGNPTPGDEPEPKPEKEKPKPEKPLKLA